jgi:hypothetical protein
MDYKKQATVLSLMFVLVGMMVVVSAITEQALARVDGYALGPPDSVFYNLRWHMDAGRFVVGPINNGHLIRWETIGDGLFGGGDERGYVSAHVGTFLVYFHFNNPAAGRGSNTCHGVPSFVSCTINPRGVFATARYYSYPLPHANGD